jgi:uncharacterized protein
MGLVRVLAIADAVSPVIYSENFPRNLPPFDVILAAGDLPGHLLEFVATKTRTPPVYVIGNHANAYLRGEDSDEVRLPGGCINAHRRIVQVGGVIVAGLEGCARYRPGPHQYGQAEYHAMAALMAPQLLWNRARRGRAVDVLLTHAPPPGPHEGEDWPHRGVHAFEAFHRLWRPQVHVHGHVHLSGANAPRRYVTSHGVRVINAFEFTLFEVEVPGRSTEDPRQDGAAAASDTGLDIGAGIEGSPTQMPEPPATS